MRGSLGNKSNESDGTRSQGKDVFVEDHLDVGQRSYVNIASSQAATLRCDKMGRLLGGGEIQRQRQRESLENEGLGLKRVWW